MQYISFCVTDILVRNHYIDNCTCSLLHNMNVYIARGEFSIDFKTDAKDGMILYMANERQVDFIALYMQAGRIVYMFNCGSGPARLTSAGTFNDGRWHTVSLIWIHIYDQPSVAFFRN